MVNQLKYDYSRTPLIILRVQSPEGTKRLEVSPSDTTCQLFERVHRTFDLLSFAFALYREKNNKEEINSSKSRTIRSLGLRHGDMLYMAPVAGATLFPEDASTVGEPGIVIDGGQASTSSGGASTSSAGVRPASSRPHSSRPSTAKSANNVQEDDVDLALFKLDGKIERKRDDKLCRHNTNARCFHCSALEPYDEAYLKEHNIKHLSFHSFLRKMTSGVDKGKFLALEDIRCGIKSGCKDHPPWPRGICSKCQPNAVTLNRQIYRHVDNVTFENAALVERFLNYWRITGHQRIGFLYGTYELHADVPLGVRATVTAIYEPPQESGRDSVRLLVPDERQEVVDSVVAALGLKKVGWIFTDLLPEDVQKGTVRHTRHAQSHFLSAQECIMAGHFQNENGNACRWASDGTFGSKLATVCVTGDKTNQVHMEGYQVSNQCMALVRDNCLVPTRDAPELGYIRESSDKQYVPDVYYKEKDSYGNEVSRLARPLPVEYLLLDVPVSTPLTPAYTFNPLGPDRAQFPIENRLLDGHLQDFGALAEYMGQFNGPDEFLSAISDFHLLLYVATMDTLPLREHMAPLLEAVRTKELAAAQLWATSEHWATVEQLIAASSPPNSRPGSVAGGGLHHLQSHLTPSHMGGGGGGGGGGGMSQQQPGAANSDAQQQWTCSYCTFLNQPAVINCEMCNLPRSGNASH